jgi:hypothetical protein
VRNYSAIFLIGGVVALTLSAVVAAREPGAGTAVLPDFMAHWTGGRLLLQGHTSDLYDPALQQSLQRSIGSQSSALAWFVTPPFVAAIYVPFAVLPYLGACAAWTAVSAGMLGVALSRLARFAPTLWVRDRRLVFVTVLASYPVFELVGGGQDSALTLVVWVGGVGFSVARRQVAAGLVFAVALVKPQLVVLVPVVFCLLRQFRALAAFCGGCVGLALASLALTGPEGAAAWIRTLLGSTYTQQVTMGQSWKMVSLPSLVASVLRPAGQGVVIAAVSATVFVTLAWFIVRAGNCGSDPMRVWMGGLATTVVASPHMVVYDAVLMVPVVLYCLERARSQTMPRLVTATFSLAWLMPVSRGLFDWSGELAPIATAPWIALPLAGIWWHVVQRGRLDATVRARPSAEVSGA